MSWERFTLWIVGIHEEPLTCSAEERQEMIQHHHLLPVLRDKRSRFYLQRMRFAASMQQRARHIGWISALLVFLGAFSEFSLPFQLFTVGFGALTASFSAWIDWRAGRLFGHWKQIHSDEMKVLDALWNDPDLHKKFLMEMQHVDERR